MYRPGRSSRSGRCCRGSSQSARSRSFRSGCTKGSGATRASTICSRLPGLSPQARCSSIWRQCPRSARPTYPRSIFIIDAGVLVLLLGGVRMARRLYAEFSLSRPGKRVLIYGAGDVGEMIVRDMRTSRQYHYYPVGFVDDDPKKLGRRIHGVPVLGARRDVPAHSQGAPAGRGAHCDPERRSRRGAIHRPGIRAVQDSDQDPAEPARHHRWQSRARADPEPGRGRPPDERAGRARQSAAAVG